MTNITTKRGQYGINGHGVTNFTLANSLIDDHGNAVEEHGIRFINLLGSALITNTTVSDSAVDNMRINNKSGVLNRLTVSNSIFDNNGATFGNNGITIKASGTASMTVRVEDSILRNHEGTGIQPDAVGTSELNVAVRSNVINDNNAGVNVTQSGAGDVDFEVSDNDLDDHSTHAINVFTASASSGGRMRGSVFGNMIGAMGTADSG